MKPIPIIFLGTPGFAKSHLQALIEDPQFEVRGVVSQPDRKSGRKMKLTPSVVKQCALDNNIPVLSPESINLPEVIEQLDVWGADALVVVAFGQLIGDVILEKYKNKIVNVHGSLLPLWRGAAPIQRSIMAGDLESGVSLQVMVKKLDAGNVIGERKIAITDEMDALILHDKMQDLGVDLLKTDFVQYLNNEITPVKQDETLVSYAHKIDKAESKVDWSLSARELFNRMRGLKMGPGSYGILNGKKLKFHEFTLLEEASEIADGKALGTEGVTAPKKPGTIVGIDKDLFQVSCAEGALAFTRVQPESKPKMLVSDFLKGNQLSVGDCFE
jgi:methionyl-tRNA formyltransferase